MAREEIRKKIIKGTTWSDVLKDLEKVTDKEDKSKTSSKSGKA